MAAQPIAGVNNLMLRNIQDLPAVNQGALAALDYRPGMLTIPDNLAVDTDAHRRAALAGIVAGIQQSGFVAAESANIVNKTGLGAQLHRDRRLAEAMADPQVYITQRHNRLVRAAEQLERDYYETFNSMFASGMSKEDADKVATAVAKGKADFEITKVNLDYPTDIVQSSLAAAQNVAAAGRGAALGMLGQAHP